MAMRKKAEVLIRKKLVLVKYAIYLTLIFYQLFGYAVYNSYAVYYLIYCSWLGLQLKVRVRVRYTVYLTNNKSLFSIMVVERGYFTFGLIKN